jgi:hypothetical protein
VTLVNINACFVTYRTCIRKFEIFSHSIHELLRKSFGVVNEHKQYSVS